MIKSRLATYIDVYPLRLLFQWAYSDGADLTVSYWNTSKESGPGFSVFSGGFFRQKVLLRAKVAKSCLSPVAHKTCLKSHHGLILILGDKISSRAKFVFYPWCFAGNALRWIKKSELLKKPRKLAVFKSLPQPLLFDVFQGNLAHLFNGPFLFSRINPQEFAWTVLEIL